MMKITNATPSSITVLVENKVVKVSGESFTPGYGSPDFIIYTSSIKNWEAPFDEVAITEDERASIVDYLLKELTARNWSVAAE